jgi:hypothetical protein
VFIESPRVDGLETSRQWELVDIRGVSEGQYFFYSSEHG